MGFSNSMFIGARLFKVIMDFYAEILFISMLFFFIKVRKDNVSEGKHDFSIKNYLVIILILVIYSLCILQSVLVFLLTYDEIFNPGGKTNFFQIVFFIEVTMTPMKDYLIALGFTYLYYE